MPQHARRPGQRDDKACMEYPKRRPLATWFTMFLAPYVGAPMLDVTEGAQLAFEPDQRTCEHCGAAFEPRTGSGGKPQRFCSPTCRAAWHASNPTLPNVGEPAPNVGKPTAEDVANAVARAIEEHR